MMLFRHPNAGVVGELKQETKNQTWLLYVLWLSVELIARLE